MGEKKEESRACESKEEEKDCEAGNSSGILRHIVNTSINSLTGLFKKESASPATPKREREGREEYYEVKDRGMEEEPLILSNIKDTLVVSKDEQIEFEKEFSQLSISIDDTINGNTSIKDISVLLGSIYTPEDTRESLRQENTRLREEIDTLKKEVYKLKKTIEIKEGLRKKEIRKGVEVVELKTLESVKIEAQLIYERKRRALLEKNKNELNDKIEKMERENIELVRYCKLLLKNDPRH